VEQLGPYVVLSELGRGGAGVVLRCRAPDGRDVAVKLLLDPAKNALLARFARERAVLQELALEGGFVPLLDAGESPRGPYLVMPFVAGGTLRDRLAREGLSLEEALELVGILAAAAGRAHARGIVHRDLKPENVLFTHLGAPLIADLGLAKHFAGSSPGAGASLSRTGELRGTAGYMAPEQIQSAKDVGPPADVFALGAILHECLTRRPAFTGESVTEVMTRVLDGSRERVRSLVPGLPVWVSDLVDRALAREVGDRFPDGAELAAAIERGQAGGERRRLLPWAAAGAGAVVVMGVVLALATLPPRGEAPAPTTTAPTTTAPTRASTTTSEAPSATTAAVPSLVVTGRLGSSWLRHAKPVTAVAISPGATPADERVLVGDADGFLYVWSLPEGRRLTSFAVFKEPKESIRSVLPVNGAVHGALVLGSRRGVAVVRPDVATMKFITTKARVVTAATGWRAPLAATVDETGDVQVFDLASGKGLMSIDCKNDPPTALAFFPDDQTLAVGLKNGEVVPVRIDPRKVLPRLFAARPPVLALTVSPDGARVAASHDEGVCSVVDLGTSVVTTIANAGRARALAFATGGKLYGAADDGGVYMADVAERTPERRDRSGSRATPGLAVTADGRALYLSAPLGQPRLLGEPLDEGHEGVVMALLPLPGGLLASGGADHTVRVWDLATGRERARAREHADHLVSLAAAPGGSFVTASSDGGVVTRDAATGRARAQHVVPARLGRVRVSPDGSLWGATQAGLVPAGGDPGPVLWHRGVAELATPGDDLLLWDSEGTLALLDPRADPPRWRRSLVRPSARCAIALVSPTRVAVSHEQAVHLLDLATGEDVWPAPVAIDSLGAGLAASPDGRWLALLQQSAVVLLSATTGEVVSRVVVTGPGDAPTAVAFAGDELLVGLASGPILRLTPSSASTR
jgi:WD40 repeat protein